MEERNYEVRGQRKNERDYDLKEAFMDLADATLWDLWDNKAKIRKLAWVREYASWEEFREDGRKAISKKIGVRYPEDWPEDWP